MAETMSIQQRIAALNLTQVGQPVKSQPPSTKPAPPPLPRSRSTDNERSRPEADGNPTSPLGNLPARAVPETPLSPPSLPTRPELRRPPSQAKKPAPTLPPRKASELTIPRRDSIESISSTISTTSSLSGPSTRTSNTSTSRRPSLEPKSSSHRVLAPTHDQSNLPPLPPKRPEQKRPSITASRSSSNISNVSKPLETVPSVPPSLPARPASGAVDRIPATSGRRESAPEGVSGGEISKKSALSFGLNKATEVIPPVPQRPSISSTSDVAPPPIPLNSRPDLARLQASKPKPSAIGITSTAAAASQCLKCRDFSGPDRHAARFSRESIPSTDVAWLSHQLTDPFPSATDKARAIFTWLHHNIAYNAEAFFSGNVQPSTPAGTISSGLAVCEGYAGLFTALAMHAGLESVVVGGHGKGYGHQTLKPGDNIPSFNTNHAWSAVKIDNGEWKLVEPCWGAGHLDDNRQYKKHFSPEYFVADNNEFGLRHFPKDRDMFFRTDGKVLSWEEYMIGDDGASTCGGAVQKNALSQTSFLPRSKRILVRGVPPKQSIQFHFQAICEHWDGERQGVGKPYAFCLTTGGKDGRKRDMIPFKTNGRHWWCDVAIQDLGCAGQTVHIVAVTVFNGKDARGMSPEELGKWIGRRAMSWESVASWQLV